MTSNSLRRRLCAGLAAPCLVLALWGPVAAAPALATPAVSFNIEAGSLDHALLAYAAQTGQQLLYGADLVAGRRAPAVRGVLSREAALDRLLAGTGLVVQHARPNVLVLKPRLRLAALEGGASLAGMASDGSSSGPGGLGVGARPDQGEPAVGRPAADAPSVLDELVVTGSLIRGANNPVSPLLSFDRDAIERSGFATVAELLSSLPQNFGATASPDTSLVGSDPRGTNDTAATGVNLRGLGAQATLVLVNGRRMAGAGLRGDFADVSAIPTAAIARVDVLLDGASALYGSDAVGGVVNIVLKRDFVGAESRVRVGTATQGGGNQVQVAQTRGTAWDSGNALLSYEFERREAVAGWQRDYTRTTDLRPLGGTDRRLIYGHPGTLLRLDPVSGAYVAAYAIPENQLGVGLKPGDFLAGQANLLNQRQDADIEPDQDRHSVYLAVNQDLGSRVKLGVDARFSRREIALRRPASISLFNVTAANPYYVSPNGAASQLIGYSFVDELGAAVTRGSSESLGVSAGLDIDLGHDWRAETYGAFASETSRRTASNLVNTRFLNEALGNLPDDPATAYVAARDGYFNPFGDTGANRPGVLAFVGSGYNRTVSASSVDSINLKADGPLWSLPGGELKAAVGAQLRRETFEPRGVSLLSGAAPVSTGERNFERQVSAAFVELRAPLIGPQNAKPWAQRLELSLAGRIERYDDVGRTTNPKLGLLWEPNEALRLRATYGTSFRAPNLTEVYDTSVISPAFLPGPAGQTLAMVLSGGNTDLKPEHATSWTLGADYTSHLLPGFKASATWFDIDFTGQIGQPVIGDTANALTNPAYAPFVRRLTPGNPADLAAVQALIARSTSSQVGLFPANTYGAIVDARYVNAAEVRVRGLDLSADYGFSRGGDRFDLAVSATYLVDYQQALTPDAPRAELLDTPGQPLDLRGRATASWSRDGFGATLGVNYADGYHTLAGRPIGSWTTTDLQLRWAATAPSGPLHGLSLALNAQNLFDVDPPFYDAPQGVGYDPANADPMGRYVSMQLSRRW